MLVFALKILDNYLVELGMVIDIAEVFISNIRTCNHDLGVKVTDLEFNVKDFVLKFLVAHFFFTV